MAASNHITSFKTCYAFNPSGFSFPHLLHKCYHLKILPRFTWTPAAPATRTPSPWWLETNFALTLRSPESRPPLCAGWKETRWGRIKKDSHTHSNTRQLLSTFVRQSEFPAISHRTATKAEWNMNQSGRAESPVIVAVVTLCSSTIPFVLPVSPSLLCGGRRWLRRREGSAWRRGRPWAAL